MLRDVRNTLNWFTVLVDRYPLAGFWGFDGDALVAVSGAGYQSDLVSPDATERCQVFQQLAVGLAINRGAGETYFQPLAPCTGDFIMTGACLYADFEDQYPVLPAIPGLGHCLVRGRSLSQLLKWG